MSDSPSKVYVQYARFIVTLVGTTRIEGNLMLLFIITYAGIKPVGDPVCNQCRQHNRYCCKDPTIFFKFVKWLAERDAVSGIRRRYDLVFRDSQPWISLPEPSMPSVVVLFSFSLFYFLFFFLESSANSKQVRFVHTKDQVRSAKSVNA